MTLTEKPTLYAVGTLEAAPSYAPLTGKGTLELSSSDGDAFLYHTEETVMSISGGGTVILANDYMPVVPVVTVTAETTLRWAIDGSPSKRPSARVRGRSRSWNCGMGITRFPLREKAM